MIATANRGRTLSQATGIIAALCLSQGVLHAQTTGEVALPGAYYGDGPWTDWNGTWLAFTAGFGSSYWGLEEVSVSVTNRGPVELCGDPSLVRTHFEVEVSQPGQGGVQLLLRGFPTVQPRFLVTRFVGPKFLLPGEEIPGPPPISGGGSNWGWTLTAYGTASQWPNGPRGTAQLTDYEVWLAREGIQGRVLAVRWVSPQDATPSIDWVGDMDRDALPDIFANIEGRRVLYLSSLAQPGQVVGEAGSIQGAGSC